MKCEDLDIYLSGYLDGELAQHQTQLVTLHLEVCEKCNRFKKDLEKARDATRGLKISQPTRREWKRMERNIVEQASRGLGWLILIIWSVVTVAYGLFQFATDPNEPIFAKVMIFSLFTGVALLFLSVLSERIRESRTDRYRGVQK